MDVDERDEGFALALVINSALRPRLEASDSDSDSDSIDSKSIESKKNVCPSVCKKRLSEFEADAAGETRISRYALFISAVLEFLAC